VDGLYCEELASLISQLPRDQELVTYRWSDY